MNEAILHYVWQFRLFALQNLKTADGIPVEVIDVGKPNTDAGPDFFNAKLKIGDTLWAGNVEIHHRSSDWAKHGHENDTAYDNVVLHVVNKVDTVVCRTDGKPIPQMELLVPASILQNYEELFAEKKWIPCENKLNHVPAILMSSWKNALLVERLERKSLEIEKLLRRSNNHWEEAFYISLARSFGFSTNGLPFEQLAKSLPLQILGKHKDNLFQLEALLFGQSGLLDNSVEDVYIQDLQREYSFLKTKYGLHPMDGSRWKLLRLRPDNFPHVRIAQFAMLVHESAKLFSKIIQKKEVQEIRKLFATHVSSYWQNHYLFGRESSSSKKQLGIKSIDSLILNTVLPFLFTYTKMRGEDAETVLKLFEEIPAEKNAVITKWSALGFPSANAFDSQALLQLKKEYCDAKKCLQCRVGHSVLTVGRKERNLGC